jgi:hypothetical protein
MIVAQEVLRWLTIRSLKGRTWVGDRVFDSPAQPADLRLSTDRAAFIAVYTDDADIVLEGGSLTAADATVHLTIEIAVADTTLIEPASNVDRDPSDPDIDRVPGGDTVTTLAQTDEAIELTIGLISRQVIQALVAPDNPWAELWRQMTISREKVEIRRGGPGQEQQETPTAVRYASRILRFWVCVVGEPGYGEGVSDDQRAFWPRLLTAFDGDQEMAPLGALLREHFEREPGLPSWRSEQVYGTYTQEALITLGITPLLAVIPDEKEPDRLTEIVRDGDPLETFGPTVPPGGPTP